MIEVELLLNRVKQELDAEALVEPIRDAVLGVSRKRFYKWGIDPETEQPVRRLVSETESSTPADRARGLMLAGRMGIVPQKKLGTEQLREIAMSDAYGQFALPVDNSTIVSEKPDEP